MIPDGTYTAEVRSIDEHFVAVYLYADGEHRHNLMLGTEELSTALVDEGSMLTITLRDEQLEDVAIE